MVGKQPGEREGMEVLAMMGVLMGTLLIGHALHKWKKRGGLETATALALGMFTGMGAYALQNNPRESKWMRFQEQFFFLFLLPPIIFESGFTMKPKPFFENFGAICTLAFLGTLLSTLAVGGLVYIAGKANLAYPLDLLPCLMFGALISATDPVTVLATFQELQVEQNMYALVFGESVLNDAVAIVLYGTLASVQDARVRSPSILSACGSFVWIFLGSMCVGVLIALLSAILFKTVRLEQDGGREGLLETCVLVCFPYCAYMLSEGIGLSGIVAILFCGIVMSHYTVKNLSEAATDASFTFFKILAKLAETFVFIYIGASVFLEDQSWKHATLSLFGLFAIFIGRAANVYPCGDLINRARRPERRVPRNHLHMLWFSGLRGPVAFALAVQATNQLGRSSGNAIMTMTIVIVLFTVFVIGGWTTWALQRMDIQCGAERGPGSPHGTRLPVGPRMEGESEADAGNRVAGFDPTAGFASLDEKYLTPFFTLQDEVELTAFARPENE